MRTVLLSLLVVAACAAVPRKPVGSSPPKPICKRINGIWQLQNKGCAVPDGGM